jgi:tRNA(Ile)-lysidine synthetase-like protein
MIVAMESIWRQFSQIADRTLGSRLKFPTIISSNDKLCVACSGGTDSVCLVLILAARFPAHRLVVLHYNHNTRGQETEEDEQFVRHLANALELDFFTEKRLEGALSEHHLRQVRYAFFSRMMAKIGSRFLFLAHHANDVIETMLMRLARGSTEIAAPKYCQLFQDGTYRVRPLLSIFKQEIVDLFTQHRIPWREDSSNRQPHYLRNRIRRIIPLFDHIFADRDWKSGFLLTHRYLEEDASCLNQMAEELCTDFQKLNLQNIFHGAIIRRAIQFWLGDLSLTRTCFEEIFRAIICNDSAKISISPETFIKIDKKILHRVSHPGNDFKIRFNNWQFGELYLPTGYKLSREIVPFSEQNLSSEGLNISTIYIHGENCTKITIRTWQPGDRYRPINAPTKSLKKLFSEKKIPVQRRSSLPILCDEKGAIIWVPHLPPADFVKVHNNYALKITFSST